MDGWRGSMVRMLGIGVIGCSETWVSCKAELCCSMLLYTIFVVRLCLVS
jgi:hypothetical protein